VSFVQFEPFEKSERKQRPRMRTDIAMARMHFVERDGRAYITLNAKLREMLKEDDDGRIRVKLDTAPDGRIRLTSVISALESGYRTVDKHTGRIGVQGLETRPGFSKDMFWKARKVHGRPWIELVPTTAGLA